MKIRYLLLCLIILISQSVAKSKNYTLNVLKQSSTELILEARFEKPILNKSKFESENLSVNIPGLLLTDKVGNYRIPFLSKQFSFAADEVYAEIIDIETGKFLLENSDNLRVKIQNQNRSDFTFFKISHIGNFRNIPIYSLNIFPVKITSNSAVWIKRIKIRVWSNQINSSGFVFDKKTQSEKNIFENMLLNGSNINFDKPSNVALEKTVQRYVAGKYKILVDEDGIYKITYQDLIDAGMDLSSVNPKNIKISNNGQEIAIYFKGSGDLSFDSGDYFEFWGEKNKKTFLNQYKDMYSDPFSDINVYWLEHSTSTGLRMVEESGALVISNPANYEVPIFFKENLHFEQDRHFEHFGQNGAALDKPSYNLDLWFYDSGIIADGTYSYDAFVPHPYETGALSVFIKAMMRGRSYQDFERRQNLGLESHQVELRLNEGANNRIGESGVWKDQELHLIKNNTGLSQSLLNHGNNQLKVIMNQLGVSDAVLMNWFEIEYWRKYRAYNNSVVFRKQEGLSTDFAFQFEIDGFTNPNIEIYKKGVSKIVNSRIDFYTNQNDNFSSYRVSFQDSIFYSGIEYISLTNDQKKKPLNIVADNPWIPESLEDVSLTDKSNSADYLLITHEILYENVKQLQQFHQQSGLNTEIVRVEDIYDEFNYGIKSPLAIKDFIKYVYNNWDQNHKLYYVNLIGTASENYKTTLESKPDLVPTLLFQTKKYGASAADFQYSLLSGGDNDVIPDIVVSRIPAKNNSEFLNYMDKLVNYNSSSNSGLWTNQALLISGNDIGTEELRTYPHAFRRQNQRLINFKIPNQFFIRKLNTIQDTTLAIDPNFGGNTDLINYWDDGLTYINFFGHGGGGIWADVQLFKDTDVERLNNGYKLPFITSMTCFTGAFENKSFATIADKLITVANKGAIGVYASSGLGWLHNDFAVGWSLADNLFEKKLTIGESILLSKIFYLSNGVYFVEEGTTSLYDFSNLRKSMVNQYNLLGEANIHIPIPDDKITINVDQNLVSVGDTINVGVNSNYSAGEVYVELSNDKNEPLTEQFDVIQPTGNTFRFGIPQELNNQLGYIKAFVTDGSQGSHGVAKIAVNKSLLDSVVIVPENPKIGEAIDLFVHIHSEKQIESVAVRNLTHIHKTLPDIILTRLSDTLYTTSTSLGPYNEESTLYFTVEIEDTSGNIAKYHQQKFTVIDPRPDLEVVRESFKFSGITDVNLSVTVKNNHTDEVSNVNIGFFTDEYNPTAVPFQTTSESFNPKEEKLISIVVDTSLLEFGKKFIVVADYDESIIEKNEINNVDSSLVYENFILINNLIGTADTLNIHNLAKIYIAPGALTHSSTMSFSINNNKNIINLDNQPGFRYIPFFGFSDTLSVGINLKNQTAKLNSPAYVAFKIDTSMSVDSLEHIGIYRFSSHLNQWVRVPDDKIQNGYKYVQTESLGEFALFYVNDNESPVIEITVNGRPLRNNMLVPSNPELAVILQDENGIDISDGIFIKIDEDTIPRWEMNVPDSVQNASAISILTSPTFQTGEHSLTVEAKDANGNKTIKPLTFKTTGDFDLIVYGNYPNPFTEETFISYFLLASEPLKEFWVKIYTVSGKMIRKLAPYRQDYFDYGEFQWDGRDEDGNPVANGVYFGVVHIKSQDMKEIEKTIKIAKLK